MSSADLLIGIDLGTSQAKGGVFGLEGRCLGRATASYPIHSPHPGWDEIDPDDWWHAVCRIIRESRDAAGVPAERIAGVGVSGLLTSDIGLD